MYAHERSDCRIDPGQIGVYTTPAAVRILVALVRGAQPPAHLAVITGCRRGETEPILRDLRQRGIVVQEWGGYRLTRSGELLADRLLACASRSRPAVRVVYCPSDESPSSLFGQVTSRSVWPLGEDKKFMPG